MKLQVIFTYIIALICNSINIFKDTYTIPEILYSTLYSTIILVYHHNKKIILLIHLIYCFLVNTAGFICNHPTLLSINLVCFCLEIFSVFVLKQCYFLNLQLPTKLKMTNHTLFKQNTFLSIGCCIYLYHIVITYLKLFNIKLPKTLIYCNYIITFLCGIFLLHDYYKVLKYDKKKNNNPKDQTVFLDNFVFKHLH